jgi:hypothetical protein
MWPIAKLFQKDFTMELLKNIENILIFKKHRETLKNHQNLNWNMNFGERHTFIRRTKFTTTMPKIGPKKRCKKCE